MMNWAHHESELRFDIRAERKEYERLFTHPARILQDRLVRCGGGDRTRKRGIPEWERVHHAEAQARRLLHQARALSWGKEKQHYFSQRAA